MITVRTVAELRDALAPARRSGDQIGLVPTMGALHDGHLSLLRAARLNNDVVVMSLFVNPTQFNEQGDLTAYPRDERRDLELASAAGIDVVFAPAVEEMYPPGFATTVQISGLTERLEGAHRGRGHFDGVTTVVTKLFNIVGPDVAYFGQKDAQQAAVIKRLVRDLDIPVRIEVCPTVREPDGLAMSSRNALLSATERERASAISHALRTAQSEVARGERDAGAIAARARAELDGAGVETEYFELVSQDTLDPVATVDGDVLAIVAARVGTTRLIDNQPLSTVDSGGPGVHHPPQPVAAGSTDNNGGS
jgi:pantoate--beta-alanine ligase